MSSSAASGRNAGADELVAIVRAVVRPSPPDPSGARHGASARRRRPRPPPLRQHRQCPRRPGRWADGMLHRDSLRHDRSAAVGRRGKLAKPLSAARRALLTVPWGMPSKRRGVGDGIPVQFDGVQRGRWPAEVGPWPRGPSAWRQAGHRDPRPGGPNPPAAMCGGSCCAASDPRTR